LRVRATFYDFVIAQHEPSLTMPRYDVPSSPATLPRDRLELLLTTRRTYLMRLRSDLMRIEGEIQWCQRYLPERAALEGDEEAAELVRGLIAVKERSVAALEKDLEAE
jgi:hypothetical protein